MLALNCAKRESTAEASGSANTPSVITTAPDQKEVKNEVLHEVQTIKICDHSFDARNNLCQ